MSGRGPGSSHGAHICLEVVKHPSKGVASDLSLQPAHDLAVSHLRRRTAASSRPGSNAATPQPPPKVSPDVYNLRLQHFDIRRRPVENYLQTQNITSVLQHLIVGGVVRH
ncbi:hypothetical protein BBO_00841 [Beauveria brongniartii RCEF 3172]|uniref:Uncharacterized protein n=1 Tax=Beauveria brongniartii RCEF 3172 TaxID=1081107 RepID=A0A162KGR1_9HYPO|nr:hypothetical protein BBO_00841 [Beauveria brongniartii RCEF 3172]